MSIYILCHLLAANQYGRPSWRTGSIFSCRKGLWDCLVLKPITTKHQSVIWLVSQSQSTSAIFVGTCQWISLAAASADPVVSVVADACTCNCSGSDRWYSAAGWEPAGACGQFWKHCEEEVARCRRRNTQRRPEGSCRFAAECSRFWVVAETTPTGHRQPWESTVWPVCVLSCNCYLLNVWEFVYLSVACLLLNAASYNGEILHADTCSLCAGLVTGFISMWVVFMKIMTCF